MGLHFPQERRRDLVRGIEAAALEFGFDSKERCIEWLLSSPLRKDQIEILASYLTVGETYFFRDKHTFDALEQTILPELIRRRRDQDRRLRIWSAGCCTGEEAYSIAIQLSQCLPNHADWNITILATDINPDFLQRASAGRYGEWSFRSSPAWIKDRYFRKISGSRYEILPHLKKMVTFSYLNLAADTYPSLINNTNAMDVILCRNVLMYFAPAQVKKARQNFYRALVPDGWLIVSAVETSPLLFDDFSTVSFPGALLYRKFTAASKPMDVDLSSPAFKILDAAWLKPA
ncbi:MAG TPA: protein-glutamate O-methyltransferase CheR, partial [Candidatus Paceibacterota bacterium]